MLLEGMFGMINKSNFLVCMFLFLFFSCSRKNVGTTFLEKGNMSDSIPVSKLNMGRTLNINFGGDYRVIFSDSTCVVLGEKGEMSVLFAQPDFDLANTPGDLRSQFYNIRMINLSVGNPHRSKLTDLPNWLEKMSNPDIFKLKISGF